MWYNISYMAKPEEQKRARKMRAEGMSIKEIAKKVGVSVGSVSLWCKDIVLTLEQIKELERRGKDPNYGRRMEYALEQRRKKEEKIEKLKKKGIKEISSLNKRELFLVGAALYWAEGFKKDSQAGFATSDPKMLRVFLKWLYESCGYKPDDLIFRATVNISHKHRIEEIEEFWSKQAGVNVDQFQKPFYQNVKWKKVYKNPNEYFGVIRVRVRKSTDFLRKIHGWIEGLRLQGEVV